MIRPILAFFFILSAQASMAQSWLWGQNTGSTVYGETSADKTVTTLTGEVYVLGEFSGTVGFGTDSLRDQGFGDVYLAKYSNSGLLLWARSIGGADEERAVGLATDGQGNAIVALDFESPEITLNGNTYANAGGDSTFGDSFADQLVAKISPTGTWLWVLRIGGTDSDETGSLAADIAGNVYVSGMIYETATVGTITIGNIGDTYILKLNANGQPQWAAQGGSVDEAGCTAYGINLNPQGTLLAATGCFVDDAVFGTTQLHSPLGTGSFDTQVYVATLNTANGAWQWAVQAGGIDTDFGTAVVVDSNSVVTMAGVFQSDSIEVGPFALGMVGAGGGQFFPSSFVTRIMPGGTFQWASVANGMADVYMTDVELTRDGDVYVAGVASDSAYFGTNELGWPIFDSNPFVARLGGADGVWQWAIPANELPGCGCGHVATQMADLSVPAVGDIFFVSRYTDSARFGPIKLVGPLYFSQGSGQGQGYLVGFGDELPIQLRITPTSGQPGQPVTISGERLGSATEVTFNGTAASFTVVNANQIQVTVPPGATTGVIRVTTPGGSTNSPVRFQVMPAAVAEGLGTITGIGPNPARESVVVRMKGATSASVLELQDAMGRTVRRLPLKAGQTEAQFSIKGLTAGLYTIRNGNQRFRLTVE